MRSTSKTLSILVLAVALTAPGSAGGDKKASKKTAAEDPYADYVWPPPPDDPRIKLVAVIAGRADVEAKGKLKRILIGASPQEIYDRLRRPYAVEFDGQGRVLVTDLGTAALIRFDKQEGRMDVLGTRGALRLKQPLGLEVGPDGTIYVADIGLKSIVALDAEGKLLRVFGSQGDLVNPTDAAVSPDSKRLFVADSKAHRIVIFDLESGEIVDSFGERGEGEGQFSFPTSLTFDASGSLFVVDQINARVQVFDGDGEFLDAFGGLAVDFGGFVRPKDVAVDEVGFIYVTDNAFNNLQLFDADFSLLTFIGEAGSTPGRFHGASGVAVQGDHVAVVDQLGHRVQLFRFLASKRE
ncbi:MAG: 6-bladed beta-propeller [Thermoanaerobaculia bacterium]